MKLLRSPFRRYIVIGDSLSVSFFLLHFPERSAHTRARARASRAERRQKVEEEKRTKERGKLAEHRIEYRHSLNYFLVVCWWSMMKINLDSRCTVVRLIILYYADARNDIAFIIPSCHGSFSLFGRGAAPIDFYSKSMNTCFIPVFAVVSRLLFQRFIRRF